jgi:hypothetical protein
MIPAPRIVLCTCTIDPTKICISCYICSFESSPTLISSGDVNGRVVPIGILRYVMNSGIFIVAYAHSAFRPVCVLDGDCDVLILYCTMHSHSTIMNLMSIMY